MQQKSSSSSVSAERIKVFVFSTLLGAFLFILIYGPYVLNPFYDAWIFESGERDLVQHYLGFCMYRSSPWQFPIGLVTTASYPHDMSVIYTDAIPIFAVLGKLLDPVLPRVFQYLGIYGMLSMSLMGGVSSLILYERVKKLKPAVISSVFFSMSWVMLYRMFYHTSLTSHWLILLAFYLWMRLDLRSHVLRNCLAYAAFSAVSILIHPYIWAMCGGIAIMGYIEYLIKNKDFRRVILYGATYFIMGFICLYVFGAFAVGRGMSLGAGSYEANLNTLINSMGLAVLPGLPLALLQYEGFGYLGIGILLLTAVSIFLLLQKRIRPVMNLHRWLLIITALCFIFFSIIPEISWGGAVLINIDLGRLFGTFVGIFRSNGRFIWPVCYMIMSYVIIFLIRHMKEKAMIILLSVCLLVQLVDMVPFIAVKHRLFAKGDYIYTGIFDGNEAIDDVIGRYDHIVMDIEDGAVDQYLSYYAYLHDMTTNDFYYARPIGSKVQNTLEALRHDMENGQYDDSLLYVLGEDKLALYRSFDLHFYEIKGRYVASHEPIEGMVEVEM